MHKKPFAVPAAAGLSLLAMTAIALRATSPRTVPLRDFARLHLGTSYSDAVRVLGTEGSLGHAKDWGAAGKVETYVWTSESGDELSGVFQSGRLISKTPHGDDGLAW